MNQITPTLDVHQRRELKTRTARINKSAGTIVEDLVYIRDHKLYREHGTFENWAKTLDLSRSYLWRMIEAHEIKEQVKMLPIGNKIDLRESHCRVLKDIPDTDLEPILEKAVESSNGEVTAAAIKKCAAEYFNANPPREPGDEEEEEEVEVDWKTLRAKAIKTYEAGMRAVDDLNDIRPQEPLDDIIHNTKIILDWLKEWK